MLLLFLITEAFFMNIDGLINNIMESYEQHGGINRSGAENFPNRQNVVSVVQDLQSMKISNRLILAGLVLSLVFWILR